MLTSLQNPLVKQIRKLHQAKERHDRELFLLEGTHLLVEACAVDYPLTTVCCTPAWQDRHPELWAEVCQRSDRVELVTPEVLKAIATTVNPDGIVATAPRSLKKTPPRATSGLLLALETIQDPGNLGTIIRAAAAADADGLWLSSDSVDLDHPKVLRASAGQWFRLHKAVSSDLKKLIGDAKNGGMQVVATIPDAKLTYWELDLRLPTVILLGNEGAGLSPDLVATANQQAKIPLSQGVESLNVAIATALILYEARRQRHNKYL